ncbi:Aromatic/aminoadipate aminotransferase 1 [Recurvomyces mirabilis]|uniref:aromatic-amino-acid transaminase n=1 Tax=Recurvomyces mirabilis TaxID=574656 RepID=A0AAE0TPR5_9PEZI|nr:Aromatic/aminoadipate aminotransferase 1 [Recurvomyces mirabilis]KAK5155770.1 Aromatic/aminoadipate aminotransferase 1 [Recurvomyces mirabilis]
MDVLPESDTSTFTVPDRLTIQAVAKRRAASGQLIAGVAAPADIAAFKGRTQHIHKSNAKRWESRMTAEAMSRGGSSLKNAAKFLKTPGLISLGGGLPSAEYFPIEEMRFAVPRMVEQRNGHGQNGANNTGKYDMVSGTSDYDIATALQYGQGHGAAQLLRWIVEHTEVVHDPPYQDWSCTMTIGSTSAFEMLLRMFAKPGDWVLSEEYTFPAAVEAALPMGVRVAAVKMDEGGMLASSLDEVLANWDETARRGPKPFLLYTVPTGQNPTGSTQSLARRREIYAVAQKHDLLILEDEPYYFLQMQPYTGPSTPDPPAPKSHQEFLTSLVPSYLSLDTDGRVVRLDSFSKVIAPGTRVGWITAPEEICKRYHIHSDLSTQSPSGASQLLLFKLLEEGWGHGGYLDWLVRIRMAYTARRNVILEACEEFLPKEIVSWTPPQAGMFMWLKVDWKEHPKFPGIEPEEVEEALFQANIRRGTLLMKGSWFVGEKGLKAEEMFFRATYAAAPSEGIREAVRRFGEAVREVFGVGMGEVNVKEM